MILRVDSILAEILRVRLGDWLVEITVLLVRYHIVSTVKEGIMCKANE